MVEACKSNAFPAGLSQPEGSLRFALDSLLLPSFVAASLKKRPLHLKNPLREPAFDIRLPGSFACADLGAGCGASAIALLKLVPCVKVWGVDCEDVLVKSARENALKTGLADRVRFETLDVASLSQVQRPFCDMVQINPPYWEDGAGRPSPHALANRARSSEHGLDAFIKAAQRLLVYHGRLFCIFPASRLVCLTDTVQKYGFGIRRLQFVRPYADARAGRVMCEAMKDAGHETSIEPDLVLYEKKPDGTAEPSKKALSFCPWIS